MENVRGTEFTLSVAVTVNVVVSSVLLGVYVLEGVPEITPLDDRDRPVGNVPLVTLYVVDWPTSESVAANCIDAATPPQMSVSGDDVDQTGAEPNCVAIGVTETVAPLVIPQQLALTSLTEDLTTTQYPGGTIMAERSKVAVGCKLVLNSTQSVLAGAV